MNLEDELRHALTRLEGSLHAPNELASVGELTIYAGKSHIGDVVQSFKMFHDAFADESGLYLFVKLLEDVFFDFVCRVEDLIC